VIFHALILGAAGAISGLLTRTADHPQWPADLLLPGFAFGGLLAAYLWFALGVRSPGKVGLVAIAIAAAPLIAVFPMGIVEVIEVVTHDHFRSQARLIMHFVLGGTVAGGLVSMVFFAALPWPRETTRFYVELLLCAAAGGLLGAAGAMLEASSPSSYSPLGAVWQGGMGVVLAVIADARLARSSADTPSAEGA
jgi:hypothetical protein